MTRRLTSALYQGPKSLPDLSENIKQVINHTEHSWLCAGGIRLQTSDFEANEPNLVIFPSSPADHEALLFTPNITLTPKLTPPKGSGVLCTPGVTLPLKLAPCEPGVLDTSQLPMHTFLSAWKKQTANTGEKELLSALALKSLCSMQAAVVQCNSRASLQRDVFCSNLPPAKAGTRKLSNILQPPGSASALTGVPPNEFCSFPRARCARAGAEGDAWGLSACSAPFQAGMCRAVSRRPPGAAGFGRECTRWCCSTFGCHLKGSRKVISDAEIRCFYSKTFLELRDK